MAGKKRLDVLLTEQGLAESRQKAQAIIMAGQVFWEGRRMDKAGASVPEDAKLEIHGQTLRYVSRGGLKLEKAMAVFDLPALQGAVVKDEEKDRLAWKEYLENVMKKRGSEWLPLYRACRALEQ